MIFSNAPRKLAVLISTGLILSLTLLISCSSDNKKVKYEKEVLFSLEPDRNIVQGSLTFSPDLSKAAYLLLGTSSLKVYLNDEEVGGFHQVGYEKEFVFSPDSLHMAFAAKRGNKAYIVKDGKLSRPYDFASDPVFNDSGEFIAYVAVDKGKVHTVKGDKIIGTFDTVSHENLVFKDGDDLLYFATENKKHFLMKNKKKLAQFDSLGGLTLSPDGKRIACGAKIGNDSFAFVDQKNGPMVEQIVAGSFQFSQNSKSFAYIAFTPDKIFGFHNNEKAIELVEIQVNKLVDRLRISPDGKKVAAINADEKKCCLYINKKHSACYDVIDGKSLTFLPENMTPAYIAQNENKGLIIIDGGIRAEFDSTKDMKLFVSQNSNDTLYAGYVGGKYSIFHNNKAVYSCEAIKQETLILSGSGKNWACVERKGRDRYVVVNGKQTDILVPQLQQIKFLEDETLVVVAQEVNETGGYGMVRYEMKL